MKLTNPKTFEKWCEKNGFRAGVMLDDAERWASECDGSFGCRGFDYETGRTTANGSPETIRFDLVRPEIIAIENDDCDCAGTIEEAVYRFIG